MIGGLYKPSTPKPGLPLMLASSRVCAQAVAELSAAVARKDEFIAVVGHELRTPLNAIVQLSHALARGAGG
jgi:signal transduction histidine kinase